MAAAAMAALRNMTRKRAAVNDASGMLRSPQPLPSSALAPAAAKKAKTPMTVDWLPYREQVETFYDSTAVQISVAFVILFNFGAIIVEKEIDPYPDEYKLYPDTWKTMDNICNIIFIFELIINIYGSFYKQFFRRGWNYLDMIVVVVGITSLADIDLGSFSQIKILRAFRILRLFKRVKSLNQILVALVKSIPGVMNAFLVMLIFMMIFSIVAVDFFSEFANDGKYETVQTYGKAAAQWGLGANLTEADGLVESTTSIDAITLRGFHYGQEYFGTFSRSLYTLFQVLTGESWSEAVVRPLLFGYNPSNAILVGVFFIVYILLTQVVLQNVVVAVLLDKFVTDDGDGDSDGTDATVAADPIGQQQYFTMTAGATDAAIVREATSSGVAVQPAGATPPPRSDRGTSSAAEKVSALLADAEQIKADQALIKVGIQAILSRLPQSGQGAGATGTDPMEA